MDVNKIIDELLGGVYNASQLLHVGYGTVYAWKMRGNIPSKWWQRIINLDKGVLLEHFME